MLARKQPFIQRVRNSSLVERPCVDNKRALNCLPKLRIYGRGAFHRRRRFSVRRAGACGKANVGMSNDKGGERPPRRKTKGS